MLDIDLSIIVTLGLTGIAVNTPPQRDPMLRRTAWTASAVSLLMLGILYASGFDEWPPSVLDRPFEATVLAALAIVSIVGAAVVVTAGSGRWSVWGERLWLAGLLLLLVCLRATGPAVLLFGLVVAGQVVVRLLSNPDLIDRRNPVGPVPTDRQRVESAGGNRPSNSLQSEADRESNDSRLPTKQDEPYPTKRTVNRAGLGTVASVVVVSVMSAGLISAVHQSLTHTGIGRDTSLSALPLGGERHAEGEALREKPTDLLIPTITLRGHADPALKRAGTRDGHRGLLGAFRHPYSCVAILCGLSLCVVLAYGESETQSG